MAQDNTVNQDFCFVYITTPSRMTANQIAQALLDAKLIACANILDHIQSLYWWQGSIQNDDECLIIAKTKTNKFVEILNLVKQLHPDQVPCILTLPIMAGNQEYFDWIEETLQS